MPRTYLSRRSDTRRDLIAEITQRRKEKKITLDDLGRRYHCTGQRIWQKIRTMQLDYDQLVDLFILLEFPDERITKYMKGGN